MEPTTFVAITLASSIAQGFFGNHSARKAEEAQREENDRANAMKLQTFREQLREAKRQFGVEQDFKERGFRSEKEQMTYNRTRELAGTFFKGLQANPQASEHFYNRAIKSQKKKDRTGQIIGAL